MNSSKASEAFLKMQKAFEKKNEKKAKLFKKLYLSCFSLKAPEGII